MVTRLSEELAEPWPGLAGPVYLVDGSTLQLEHTRKLVRAYPLGRNQHRPEHWPILRLVVMHEVSSGMALYPQWGPLHGEHAVSEQSLAARALPQLSPGSVVIADRNFGVFSVAWEAGQRGCGVIVRLTKVRAEKLFSGPISREGTYPVSWRPSRCDQVQMTAWPKDAALAGRLIAARVGRGKSEQRLYLFTTLTASWLQVVAICGQPWHSETDLRSLKQTVHLQHLQSRSVDRVEKELLTAICAYNFVRAVMCLAARRVGIAPRRLSFTQVLDVVNCAWPSLDSAESKSAYDAEFEKVLDWAAACKLPAAPGDAGTRGRSGGMAIASPLEKLNDIGLLACAGLQLRPLPLDAESLPNTETPRLHAVRNATRARIEVVRILGIESSCDETAAAVVENGDTVLSSVVASQLATHGKYGGVVPELASREHLRAIVPVVREALDRAGVMLPALNAIAATVGPGLVGSLLVGLTYAKSLSFATGVPLIAVNHIEGHIHAVILEAARARTPVEFPALALVASGGHTHLFEVREGFLYRLLGKTRDDAAGEAFDKVAKLLGFGYPGGPIIDLLAPFGDPGAVRFTFAKMKGNALDFSFSGLKTAVLRWVEARDMNAEIERRKALRRETANPTTEDWLAVTPVETLNLLASFQRAVVHELLTRAAASAEQIGARTLIVSGGVACNSGLRAAAQSAGLPYPVHFPSPGLSTDNAAMIAAAAFPKLERGEFAGLDVKAQANLALA